MPSRFFNQLLLISQFELKRALITRKGLLALLAFAVVWYFILLYPLRYSAELLVEEKGMAKTFGKGFSFFDFIGLHSLQNWTIPEFAVLWHFALILFPMLSISLAADQTSSDRERGTLRFLVLRTSRDSLFFGRFTGVMLIQILLISAVAFSTLALIIYRDATLFSSALPNLTAIIVNLTLVVLPFTALMAVLSVKVKSARQATLWAVLIWTFLAGIISGLAYYLPALSILKYLVPGYQLTDLAQLSGWQTLQLMPIPVIQSILLLGLGRWFMVTQSL